MRIFISLILLIITSLLSYSVYAHNCTSPGASYSVELGNFIVPNNLSVGSKIGGEHDLGEKNAFTCTDTSGVTTVAIYIGASGTVVNGTTFDGRFIYETGIAGVGYAIGASSSNCTSAGTVWVSGGSGAQNQLICRLSSVPSGKKMTVRPVIQLYRLNANLGTSTVMKDFMVGKLFGTVNNINLGDNMIHISTQKIATGCTVSTTDVQVSLGAVNSSALDQNLSSVYGSEPQSLSIGMKCDLDTKVYLQIDSSQTVDTVLNQLGILNISSSGDNAAKGVGIQILKSDRKSVFPLGSRVTALTTTTIGNQTITLFARYVQLPTGTTAISAGQANASATFTLTYP